jgi:hypothetical protein
VDLGGTRDILHGDRRRCSTDSDGLGDDLARLAADERLRAQLGLAARHDVHARLPLTIVERIERVYRSLVLPQAA